jgi:hypothetical protein
MESWADRQLAILRPIYAGRWDIWYVMPYTGGATWCAKPAGAPVATITADSPEHLIEAISDREAAQQTR